MAQWKQNTLSTAISGAGLGDVSRGASAKTCKGCGALKDRSEFHRNARSADGHLNTCKQCCSAARRERRLANLAEVREKERALAKTDAYKARKREQARKRRASNPAAIEYVRAYRAARRDHINAQQRKRRAAMGDAWYAKYAVSMRAADQRRRAAELNATPSWATGPDYIAATIRIFAEAAQREKETGVPHHVDHIIPLQGKTVCGLHVPWNLQVLPAEENLRKSNKLLEAA